MIKELVRYSSVCPPMRHYGYCHVNYPERKELVSAFPSGARHLLIHMKCFGSESPMEL